MSHKLKSNFSPWPKMPRWFSPCLPVWNQVYHRASGLCGSYYASLLLSRSCLGLWACSSCSGILLLQTFTWLIDSGLSPTLTSSGWPVLTALSLPHHCIPLLCLMFSEPTNTWNYIPSVFVYYLSHLLGEGQNVILFTTIFPGPGAIEGDNQYSLNDQRSFQLLISKLAY